MNLDELAASVQKRCILTDREYQLASGKRSSYYYDGKRGMLAADLKIDLARALWQLVGDLQFDVIGGQAIGSVPLSEQMSIVAKFDDDRDYDTFYVRDDKKKHGTGQTIYEAARADGSRVIRPGVRVLVLDDVVTTGGSLKLAIDALEQERVEIVGVIVLVDRQDPDANWLRDKYEFRPLFVADANGNLSPAATPVVA